MSGCLGVNFMYGEFGFVVVEFAARVFGDASVRFGVSARVGV